MAVWNTATILAQPASPARERRELSDSLSHLPHMIAQACGGIFCHLLKDLLTRMYACPRLVRRATEWPPTESLPPMPPSLVRTASSAVCCAPCEKDPLT